MSLLSSILVAPLACSGADPGAPAIGGSDTAGVTSSLAGGGGSSALGGAGRGGNASSAGAEVGLGGAGDLAGGAGADSGNAGAAGDGGSPALGVGGASGACDAVVMAQTLAAGIHVTACTPIDYATNPPSSGQHYPVWADFGAYDFPLPRGYWVHNLEHGAVVVTYNCPGGCADEVARAKTWLAQLQPDVACTPGAPRVLLVPDPKLDVRWAASSWGFTLRASCFDEQAFTDFYNDHVGQPLAPEAALCSSGFDFRAPGADTCGANP